MVDEEKKTREIELKRRGSDLINAFNATFDVDPSENVEPVAADTAILLSLAHFESSKRNFSEARRLYRRIVELEPGNLAALTGLSSVELLDGQPLQAQGLLLQAARVRALDGLANEARGLYRQAVDSFPPRAAAAWAEWGSFEEWQGNAAKARDCFEQSAQLDPSSYAQWAGFVARQDGPDKACGLLHRAHADGAVGPQLTTVWAEWGLLESRLGDYTSGEKRLREALDRAQKDGDLAALAQSLVRLARALAEMGRRDEAGTTFQQALQADPHNPFVKAHAADFLAAARGQTEAAAALYAEALGAAPHSYKLRQLDEKFRRLLGRPRLLASWVALRDCAGAASAPSAERAECSRGLVLALAEELGCATAPLFLSTQKFYGLKLAAGELLGERFAGLELPVMVVLGPQLSRDDIVEVCSELSQEHRVDRSVIILPFEGSPRFQANAEATHVRGVYHYDIILLDRSRIVHLLQAPDLRRTACEMILSQVKLTDVSPFKTHGPVSEAGFFGREKELGEITERVRTSSYVIVGGRLIGKTSILKQLQKVRLPHRGFNAFFHDCSPTPTEAKLVRMLTGRWFAQPPPRPPESFADVIQALPTDKPLIILLDEVDKIIKADRKAGYPIFNTIAAFSKDDVCRFVLCGERALLAEVRDSRSPLYNTGSPMFVGGLEPQAVEELVTQSMMRLRIELTDRGAIIRRIQEFSSGHPNVVQRICERLVERLHQRYPPQIMPEDVLAVAGDPDFLKDDFLKVYWQGATVLERLSTLLMVKDESARTLDTVRQAFTRHGLEAVSIADLRLALERLVDLRNILKRTGGGYEFVATAFGRVFDLAGFADDYIAQYGEEYVARGDLVPEGEG